MKEVESLRSSSKVCSNYESFQNKINDLNRTLEKFTNDKKNLKTLIDNQRCALNKERLRYILGTSKGFYKNLFVRKTTGNQTHIACFYYGQKGHSIHSFVYKRKSYIPQVGEKLVWLPKSNNSPKTNKASVQKLISCCKCVGDPQKFILVSR